MPPPPQGQGQKGLELEEVCWCREESLLVDLSAVRGSGLVESCCCWDYIVMGNDIRDSTGTNEEHSSLKLSVYSTFISKLDKTDI